MEDRYKEDNENPVQSRETVEEIDLTDIFRQLWIKRRFILKITGIFLLLGLFIALFSPVRYTAHCTVVPQSGRNAGSNLGGIAAMMGVNIATGTTSETLSPSVYPQIIKSIPFTREIMQTPIKVAKSDGKEITLYDYYTNKEYQPFNLIGSIKKYTIGLPGLLMGFIRGNDDKVEHISTPSSESVLSLSSKETHVYRTIQKSIQLNLNSKEGYITINYSFPDAEASALITDQVRKTLEHYVKAFKSEKAEDNLAFVEQSFANAQADFLEKQKRLAAFQDTNRGLTTASARSNEQRLSSEYDIAFTVYNELAKQLEQARLAVKETKPVFTVVEPVVIPVQKSAPRRVRILAVYTLLGLIGSVGWIFTKSFFINTIRGVKEGI